jgi:hypothetical protein
VVSWAEYTRAARELADLRRADDSAAADRAAAARTAGDDLDRLTTYLETQREYLLDLARKLKLPEPWIGPGSRSPVTDVAQALHRAADASNAAEAEARKAERAASRPILLPDASPTVRNVAIYSAWAFAAWLLQCGLSTFTAANDFGALAWSLCGIPAVAFFGGYLTVSTLGQPRVGADHPKQVRLGGVICFGGLALAWIATIALLGFLRG